MGNYSDVMMVEGVDGYEAEDEMEFALGVQRMINAGQWALQGSFGRQMMRMITEGQCMLGNSGARDYYGNYIPSRDEVQDGTKGSKSYVAEMMGEEWAEAMAKA